MNDCIFCKIINKEIPASFLFEDEDLIVIKDIKPKAPVHLLVIPKEHIVNLDDVSEKHANLLSKILLTSKKLASENNISGRYKVATNIGELGGQVIFHMHFHLVGGWEKKEDVESLLVQ